MEKNEKVEAILDFLASIRPLSEACRNYLRKNIKSKSVKKKGVLLKIGEINNQLYFIAKGALKCYYYHDDKEVCDWFFFENETVVSIGSFYDQSPGEDCIEAVEDTVVYYITKQNYDHLNETCMEFNYVARVLLEKYLRIIHMHARLIRRKSPIERYRQVMEKMPEIMARIRRKDVASWLNMKAETLSRKKNVKRKQEPPRHP